MISKFAALQKARSLALARVVPRNAVGRSPAFFLMSSGQVEEERYLSLGNQRFYTRCALMLDETAQTNRKKAQEFNVRRAAYKEQVSKLRKEYAAQVAAQRAADEAEQEAKRQEQTRLKLERQRAKNIRSAQNAIRQREMQQQRKKEREEELRIAQENREALKARFAKARQLVVDELEEEAPLWLTTPEEVEKAFTPEAEQLLWARPNGVLGAPMPTEDAEFWRYESHTWHMDKTYVTQRELLLEELQEMSYVEANVDKSFWTEERLQQRTELEEKAKLRAMVRDEGRRVLLQKQKEMLQDNFSAKDKFEIPKAMPVPNVQVLANTAAMEKEGAEVVLNDPTKFFEFESSASGEVSEDDEEGDSSSYQGPSLGVPVRLKDPVRNVYSQNRPYPLVIGKMPKPDLRSEKEKKREAKERAMWAATQSGSSTDKQQADIEYEAEDNLDSGEPLDYDSLALEYDSDDEEWMEGLDPEEDADLINLPREYRYKEEDVEWVIGELEHKVGQLEDQLRIELETAQQEMSAKRESEEGERKLQGEDLGLEDEIDGEVSKTEGTDERGQSYVQYVRTGEKGDVDLHTIGVDVDGVEKVFSSLTEEQMMALYFLDDMDTQSMSSDQLKDALKKVPGLTEEQATSILKLEQSLGKNEKFKEVLELDSDDKEDY